MNQIEINSNQTTVLDASMPFRGMIDTFLSRRRASTRRSYESDLVDFARFACAADKQSALQLLVSLPQGRANALAHEYKADMIKRGLSSATLNRRLATLRSAVKLANVLGLVNWSLHVENEKSQRYRDTKGTGTIGFLMLLRVAEFQVRNRQKSIRDVAILHLLYDLALRRGEIAALDVADFDAQTETLSVRGKGKEFAEKLTLPEPTAKALREWLETRGKDGLPLFTNFDRAGKGSRLTTTAIYCIVRDLGRKAGIEARPHGLRHAAITAALDLTNGNVRLVREFSRHANVQTVMVYDDKRHDHQGEIAKLVASQA